MSSDLSLNKFFKNISFILPAIVLLVLLTGYPLIEVIKMSFLDYTDRANATFGGISNYINMLKDAIFWKSLVNTLIFTFISVGLNLVIGMTLAVLLNQNINSKIRSVFRSIFMFPWLISSTVVASIWVLMLNPFGIINGTLQFLGFSDLSTISWLSDERFALLGVILGNVWRGFPFVMLMLLAGIQTVPNDIREAAYVDGANRFKAFYYIILPQLKGIILTVTTLEIIWNFRSFDLVYLMTGGGPMNSTEVLSTYIYDVAFRSLDFGYASTIAIFMLLVMTLVSSVYLKMALNKED